MANNRSLILVWFTTISISIGGSAPAHVAAGDFRQAVSRKPQPTVASLVDSQITTVEKLVIDAADAMPEARFGFSPESLTLPHAEYKDVRTFALEVKHIAASNFALWAPLTGEKFPDDFIGGDGPAAVQTKADIITFLKDSYALGHRAASALTAQNMLQPATSGSSSIRLDRATFGVAHAYDHYGQMVEYLRMSGIVPPASRGPAARELQR
jgi:DinB superfamily